MSGAEAFAVLGVISSIITIVDTTKKVYDAATNAQGLPEAFGEVAGRLPIVENTLDLARQNIEEGKVKNDTCKGVKGIVGACEEKAKRLKELFEKAIPADGASGLKRYVKAVKILGRGSEVEKLMEGMLEDVQLLACESGMKTATKAQQEQIVEAIQNLSAVMPSVPEHEFQEAGFTNSNYGPGTQYNARGEFIARGTARQYNSGGGSMNFGHTNFEFNAQSLSVSCPIEEEAYACLRLLFLTDMRAEREKLISTKGRRVDGTCKWIKKHPLYKSWSRSRSQLLRLSGSPGKGKTMLSIFLAEELEREAMSQNKLFLQYFCDNKDEKRNTAIAVLRGLIYQLLESRWRLFDHILPIFKVQRGSLVSFETLWRIFESMVCDPTLETTYCVLDGLDECDEPSLEVFLERLADLIPVESNELSTCHLNILVASREIPDFIPALLEDFPRISLNPDADTKVAQDIQLFIHEKVNKLSRDKRYPEALSVHVEKVFQDRAEGTFLWIGIVAQALRKYKPTEVEEALNLFPRGLDELYARILLQIDSHRRELAARILRWVVMAARPLTLLELSHAIEPTEHYSSVTFSREERIRDQVSYCGYFLEIREAEIEREMNHVRGRYGDSSPDETEVSSLDETKVSSPDEQEVSNPYELEAFSVRKYEVGLIHQSAKDYLLRKTRDLNPELEAFRVKEETANSEIASGCLNYLQQPGALADSEINLLRDVWHLRSFPLLSYAALHWHQHARLLARSDDVFDLSLPFYHEKSQIYMSWHWSDEYGSREAPESFTLLHFASFFGILPLAENLLLAEDGMDKAEHLCYLNIGDSSGMTALMWAAYGGHEALIPLLLDRGADTEAENHDGCTALQVAAGSGHDGVVELLLEKETDIDAQDKHGETALLYVTSFGREATVRLLLEKGADVNAQNIYGWKALMTAAKFGYTAIIQLLLEKGADINARDKNGETALMKPDESWTVAVVQLLLEKGADINAQDKNGDTALMKAAVTGREATVQLLLEKGADSNTQNEHRETALIKAAAASQEAIVRLLLEKGSDINTQNRYRETALMMAVTFGPLATVLLLLENGADINARDIFGETPLMFAAQLGHKAVVQILLEKGADFRARDKCRETALMKVANPDPPRKEYEKSKYEAIIQLLTLYQDS